MVKSFDDVLQYLQGLRASTIRELGDRLKSAEVSLNALFGRNVGDTSFKSCNPNATYHITGYDGMRALHQMALAEGSDPVIELCLRNHRFYTADLAVWWHQRFGTFPGEDAQFEPCRDRTTLRDNEDGDTDLERHRNEYWHLTTPPGPDYGNAFSQYVHAVMVNIEGAYNQVLSQPTELLRTGNRISNTCGVYWAAKAAEDETMLARAVIALNGQIRWIFDPKRTLQVTARNGETIQIHCYGWRDESGKPPFPYGFFDEGIEPWYVGHNGQALIDAYKVAHDIGDPSFRALVHDAFTRLTQLLDHEGRMNAPIGDRFFQYDDQLVNAQLQGGKHSTPSASPLLSVEDEPLTASEFFRMKSNEEYFRHIVAGSWIATGRYLDNTWQDPRTSRIYTRWHDGGTIRRDTPRPLDVDTGNGYAAMKCAMLRAAVRGEWDAAAMLAFDYCAYPHRSETRVRKDRAIPAEIGYQPSANYMNYSRPWWWAVSTLGFAISLLEGRATRTEEDSPLILTPTGS